MSALLPRAGGPRATPVPLEAPRADGAHPAGLRAGEVERLREVVGRLPVVVLHVVGACGSHESTVAQGCSGVSPKVFSMKASTDTDVAGVESVYPARAYGLTISMGTRGPQSGEYWSGFTSS